MKQPDNDENIWVCQCCGQGLGKHHCPGYENPAVGRHIDKLETKRNRADECFVELLTYNQFSAKARQRIEQALVELRA